VTYVEAVPARSGGIGRTRPGPGGDLAGRVAPQVTVITASPPGAPAWCVAPVGPAAARTRAGR